MTAAERSRSGIAELVLILLGIVPAGWLGLHLAPHLGGGLPGLIAGMRSAVETPFSVTVTGETPKCVLGCLGIYALTVGIALSSRRNTRIGAEHGSAKWGNVRLLCRKYASGSYASNLIFTQGIRLGLDSRQHRRNLNVLIVGGSGAGKTRFYAKPNLYQANTSFVVLDPKTHKYAIIPLKMSFFRTFQGIFIA